MPVRPSMSLAQLLTNGGWAMWPIYVCSVVAMMVTLQRILVYHAAKLERLGWLQEVWDATARGELRRVASLCAPHPHPVARALQAMAEVWPRRPDRAEAEAGRVGSAEVQRLERYLTVLGFIARVAPLLGLLGTVIGMVRLFVSLENAGPGQVDVRVLSGGIWQALLTTAAGVVVAVPSLAAHAWLLSRVDRVRLQLHDAVERFLTALPIDAAETDKDQVTRP